MYPNNITQPKVCDVCQESYPQTRDHWHKSKTSRGGLLNICKQCQNERMRTAYRIKHPVQHFPERAFVQQGNILIIVLTHSQETIIDVEDADLATLKWCGSDRDAAYSYAIRHTKHQGKTTRHRLHRIILERKIGRSIEKREYVDHIDGNTRNNRRENLRLANYSQNMHNSKKHINNKSGYKGVYWSNSAGKWESRIMINGKIKYLGSFSTAEEGHIAYCNAAKQYHGEFYRTE